MRWFESSHPSHKSGGPAGYARGGARSAQARSAFQITGVPEVRSTLGRAADFDSAMRWFESSHPSHKSGGRAGYARGGRAARKRGAPFRDSAMRWFESSHPNEPASPAGRF